MRIVEILLPKNTSEQGLSPQTVKKIDALQSRMDSYVDKILSPTTSSAGKEFLKTQLRSDYHELRSLIPKLHEVAEMTGMRYSAHALDEDAQQTQYEVYDRKTKDTVSGPYSTSKRAKRASDKKDMEYGAIRYGVREVGGKPITEAVHKLPLTDKDFELVKELFNKPIPAAVAPIYICEIIDDDELNSQLLELEDSQPGLDVRPIIAEWFNRVMPDQMFRFNNSAPTMAQMNGVLSPIHGYDSHMYKGTNDPLTGDSYGSI